MAGNAQVEVIYPTIVVTSFLGSYYAELAPSMNNINFPFLFKTVQSNSILGAVLTWRSVNDYDKKLIIKVRLKPSQDFIKRFLFG